MCPRMRNLLSSLLILSIMLLCGCQQGSVNAPTSSVVMTYDYLHGASRSNQQVFCDVTINRILDGIYHSVPNDDGYFLALCQVKNAFNVTLNHENHEALNNQGSFLLWIGLRGVDPERHPDLRTALTSADSLIIYAHSYPFRMSDISECAPPLIKALTDENIPYSVEDGLIEPIPTLFVYNLPHWDVIPISNGIVSADALQDTISAGMAYNINTDRKENICAGDTIEEVYSFLEDCIK